MDTTRGQASARRGLLGHLRRLLSRKRPADAPPEGHAPRAGSMNRREVFGALGPLPVAGVMSYPFWKDDTSGSSRGETLDALSEPTQTLIPQWDYEEYVRLKDLDLCDPQVRATQQRMPVGKIGDLTMGRLISGSNLISMNMHARDLGYVGDLATRYNTKERIFMTLKRCEEYGVNGINLKSHNFRRFELSDYWQQWKGRMLWIADVITRDIDDFERLLVEHLELGASAAYLWGGSSDIWYYENRQDDIVRAFEIMKRYNIPAGIGAHRLEPIRFCEREGLKPDFYIKTLHHDQYWSAHPSEHRKYMEMFRPMTKDHETFHDNFWCDSAQETIDFMQDVTVPWIAFKVLAAGAIPPEEGIHYAFQNGADFVCVGMFDFQVKEDAELTQKAVAKAGKRKRPWRG